MRLILLAFSGVLLAWAGPAAALSPAEVAHLEAGDRQAQLEAGARAEGKVTLYTALIVDQVVRPLAAGFEARYPFLKLDYWRGESRSIVQKVLAERRAGALQADVIEGTGLADTLVNAGTVESFASPELAGFDARYLDPRGFWGPLRFDYYGASVNPKLAAAPARYDDLLAPQWRGKIAWLADNESGAILLITALRLAWGEARAESYFKRLAAQNLVAVTASARTLVNRVIEGEYPLALGVALHHAAISAAAGASVAPAVLDPVPALLSIVMLAKGAQHPYAAMLLIDFLLSKEGQAILRDRQYLTARADTPPLDSMKAIVPRFSGHTELFMRPEEFSREHAPSEELLERLFP